MWRKLLLAVALALVCSATAEARASFSGWCTSQASWTRVTSCTVTIYDAGTLNLSTIYSDNSGTALANPFTANATTGAYQFFAANGRYDVRLSGGSPTISPAYVQYSSVVLLDVATTGQATTFTGNLLFSADNTYDIGASGATRPRTGYFGTSVVTPLLTITDATRTIGSVIATPAFGTVSNHTLGLMSNNTVRWNINTSGHLLANVDSTYDIGVNGTGRPRDLYVARQLYVVDTNFYMALSASNPVINFDANDYLSFDRSANTWQFISGGTANWAINSSGYLLGSTDNTFDIGTIGAFRPRTVYLGTSVVSPVGSFGTSPAASGAVRIGNNASVCFNNNAGSGDVCALNVNTSDQVVVGAGASTTKFEGIVGNGTALKFASVSTGSIGASSSTAVTVTFSGVFTNSGWFPFCNVIEATAGTDTLRIHHIESVTNTTNATAVVRVVNDSSTTSRTGTVYCMGRSN